MKRSTRQTLADVAVMAQHATVLVGPVVVSVAALAGLIWLVLR